MFFRQKKKGKNGFQIDLSDLDNEKDKLCGFLRSNLKASVESSGKSLSVYSEDLSADKLQRIVTKFVYHRNLNLTHWVSVEGAFVKINRFKLDGKKRHKGKKDKPHQTAMQSWGL